MRTIFTLVFVAACIGRAAAQAPPLPQDDETPPEGRTTVVEFEVAPPPAPPAPPSSTTTNQSVTNIANVTVAPPPGIQLQGHAKLLGIYSHWNHQYCGVSACWWLLVQGGFTFRLAEGMKLELSGLVGAAPSSWQGDGMALGVGADFVWTPSWGWTKERISFGAAFKALFDPRQDGAELGVFALQGALEIHIVGKGEDAACSILVQGGPGVSYWHTTKVFWDDFLVGLGLACRGPRFKRDPGVAFPPAAAFQPASAPIRPGTGPPAPAK